MQVIKAVQVSKIIKGKKCMKLKLKLKNSFRDENSQVFHYLQSLLINTSLTGLSISSFESNMLLCYIKYLFFPLVIPVLRQALWQAG